MRRYRELVALADRISKKLERRGDAGLERELAEVEAELKKAKVALTRSDHRHLDALKAQAEEDPEHSLEAWLDALEEELDWRTVTEATSREIERLHVLPRGRRDDRRLAALVARHNAAIDQMASRRSSSASS